MARAREIEAIAPDSTFREAAAGAVRERAREVFEHEPRALDLTDAEGVHDMRVATRRLRAALELYAPAFPRKAREGLIAEVKDLADDLGSRRDPDVAIESLARLRDRLPAADHPGVDSLVAALEQRRHECNERLAAALTRAREGALAERLDALAEAALTGGAAR